MPKEPDIGILLGIGKKKPAKDGPAGYGSPSGFGDELIAAVKANDGAAVESCLRDAWAEWEEEPHTEGEHTEEEPDESMGEGKE